MATQSKRVLMITVSYNSAEFLDRAIRQAFTQKYDGGITVYLVDNASKDNSWEIAMNLREEFPELIITHLEQNTGFAGGNNHAIRQFFDTHGYFYLHNPDAYFENDHTIADLVAVMQKLDDSGILQPVLCNPDGEIASTGNVPFYLGMGAMGNKPITTTEPYQVIGSVSGAAMLLPKKVLEKIGLLKELYLAYHEDLEISLRARLAGFENYVATQVTVPHEHNFSKGSFKFYLMERNRYYQLIEYFDVLSLVFLAFPLFILDVMITAYFFMNGWYSARFKVYTHVWQNRKELMLEKEKLSKFKSRESMIRLYKSLSPVLSTKELAKPGTALDKVFKLVNVFFALYYRLFMFVYINIISKLKY